MSLREEIERRRMAHAVSNAANKPNGISDTLSITTPASTPTASPPVFLRVMKLDKQCWVLPWACFQGIGFSPSATFIGTSDKCERLNLVFLRHEVIVHGYNLINIIGAIEEMALHALCEISEKYLDVEIAGKTARVLEISVNKL